MSRQDGCLELSKKSEEVNSLCIRCSNLCRTVKTGEWLNGLVVGCQSNGNLSNRVAHGWTAGWCRTSFQSSL